MSTSGRLRYSDMFSRQAAPQRHVHSGRLRYSDMFVRQAVPQRHVHLPQAPLQRHVQPARSPSATCPRPAGPATATCSAGRQPLSDMSTPSRLRYSDMFSRQAAPQRHVRAQQAPLQRHVQPAGSLSATCPRPAGPATATCSAAPGSSTATYPRGRTRGSARSTCAAYRYLIDDLPPNGLKDGNTRRALREAERSAFRPPLAGDAGRRPALRAYSPTRALKKSLKVPWVWARCWARKPIMTMVPSPCSTETMAALLAMASSPRSQPLWRMSRST